MSLSTRKTRRLTQLSLMIAIEAVLFLTPLGIIIIPPVSITTMHIPVIIAGIILGPTYGAIVGASFGLMSLVKAVTQAVSPVDMLFSPFVSGNPLGSIVLCIVTRIMLGFIAGWAFSVLKRVVSKRSVAIGITAIISTIAHTLMVLGCLFAFFSALPLQAVFTAVLTLNGIVETFLAVILSIGVATPLLKMNNRA